MNEILPVVGSIALRVTVIYLALLALLRIGGRRELAQLTPADMLLLLLLSEVVSPSLTGGYDSIGAGMFGAALLVLLTWGIGVLTFRSRKFEAIVEGNSLVLVRNGKVDQAQLRSLRITDRQLHTFLHEHGVMRIDQVAVAYVEPSGKVTVIKYDEVPEPPAPKRAATASRDADAEDDAAAAAAQLDALKLQLAKLEETLRRLAASRDRDGAAPPMPDEPPRPSRLERTA